jgi:hypothetical protein
MITRSWNRNQIVLQALSDFGDWVSSSRMAAICVFPPEYIHRVAGSKKLLLSHANAKVITDACCTMRIVGLVESRPQSQLSSRHRREYRITDKGREHLAKINARLAKVSNGELRRG